MGLEPIWLEDIPAPTPEKSLQIPPQLASLIDLLASMGKAHIQLLLKLLDILENGVSPHLPP